METIEEQIENMLIMASAMRVSNLPISIKIAALEVEVALRKLGLEILKAKVEEPV